MMGEVKGPGAAPKIGSDNAGPSAGPGGTTSGKVPANLGAMKEALQKEGKGELFDKLLHGMCVSLINSSQKASKRAQEAAKRMRQNQ